MNKKFINWLNEDDVFLTQLEHIQKILLKVLITQNCNENAFLFVKSEYVIQSHIRIDPVFDVLFIK